MFILDPVTTEMSGGCIIKFLFIREGRRRGVSVPVRLSTSVKIRVIFYAKGL